MNLQIIKNNEIHAINQTINDQIFGSWIAYIDATPKTISTYTRAIKQFSVFLSDNDISNPTRSDIIAYRESLKANHKPTTIQSYLAAVKLFFSWTKAAGYNPAIADHVKGVKLDTEHKKDYLTVAQIKTLLDSIDIDDLKGKRDYAIIALMLTTGLRTISVINANIEDIRTAGDATVLYYKGKGHNDKAIYVKIADPVETAIRRYLKARGSATSCDPLFAAIANRNSGGKLTTRSLSRIVKDNLKEAGYNSDRLTAHSLRHTAATLNLLNGGTVEETQQLLDHTNINTTLIYAHALERAKNNSETRIASAIFA